jgi:MoaA/NifB/PqqE/SkfB family radical SAM enzyme
MSAGTFTKIIDELSAHQESTLVIGGLGEPSVHPHLGEMLDQLKKRQIKNTMFSTNGSLLRFFSPEQILTWNIQTIVVSIDGLDSESYSQIRIGGNYDGLRECLHNLYCARKSLKKVFPIIEIRHVIFPNETAAQLRKFQRHWLKYADTVKYNFVVPSFSTIEFPTEELRRCREIRRTLYVRWDGRVPLCGYQYLYSEAESLGTIDNYSIEELFKHPRLQDLRELHSHKDFSNFDFCRYCVFTHG